MKRTGFIGATDAMKIMGGDPQEIYELYLVKIGEAVDESLDHIFPVWWGKHCEKMHIEWLRKNCEPFNKMVVNDNPEHVFRDLGSKQLIPMRGNYDATVDTGFEHMVLETKITGGYEDFDTLLERYYWQLVHHCFTSGVEECWFSVVMGNRAPEYRVVTPSLDDTNTMVRKCIEFAVAVDKRTPPEGWAETPPKPTFTLDGLKPYDMSENNAWCVYASEYLATTDAASKNTKAKKELLELLPDDAIEAKGAGICIYRTKSNKRMFKVLD